MGPGGRGDRRARGRCLRGLRARCTHRLSRRRRWHMTCAEGRRWPSCEISSRLHDGSNPGNRILRSTMRTATRRNPQLGRGADGPAPVRPGWAGRRAATGPRRGAGRPRRSGGGTGRGAGRAKAVGGRKSPAKAGRGPAGCGGRASRAGWTGDAARGAYGSCPVAA
ncbi:hypothetical protein SSBG_04838 [Streptomyces sp. SPB074]|nr:hypothetical protein SSBG_04838 [Streptomyces sp. SPB074]